MSIFHEFRGVSGAALGEQILRSMGYEVTAFEDSREARHWFFQHPYDIDLVISDVTMPEITLVI